MAIPLTATWYEKRLVSNAFGSNQIRINAVNALSRRLGCNAIPLITHSLAMGDDSVEVFHEKVAAIQKLKASPDQIASAYVAACGNQTPAIVKSAVNGLASVASQVVREETKRGAVNALLSENVINIRLQITIHGWPRSLDDISDYERALQLFAAVPERIAEVFGRALRSNSPVTRAHAAKKLAELGAMNAVPSLLPKLDDPSDPVRQEVNSALKKLGADKSDVIKTVLKITNIEEKAIAQLTAYMKEWGASETELLHFLRNLRIDLAPCALEVGRQMESLEVPHSQIARHIIDHLPIHGRKMEVIDQILRMGADRFDIVAGYAQLLRNPERNVQISAWETLWEMGIRKTIPQLKLMKETDVLSHLASEVAKPSLQSAQDKTRLESTVTEMLLRQLKEGHHLVGRAEIERAVYLYERDGYFVAWYIPEESHEGTGLGYDSYCVPAEVRVAESSPAIDN